MQHAAIARRLGISRTTVVKAAASAATPRYEDRDRFASCGVRAGLLRGTMPIRSALGAAGSAVTCDVGR